MPDRAQEIVATGQAAGFQVTVGPAAVLVRAARDSRVSVLVVNNGTAVVYLGKDVNVSVAPGPDAGIPLAVGASFEERDYTGDIYAISGTAGQDVRGWETG